MKRLRYIGKDFAWIEWGPEEIRRAAEETLEEKTRAYRTVKSILAEKRTFENTVYAIEASNHGAWRMHAVALLMNVSPRQDVREAAKEAAEMSDKALVDIEYDADLYRAVKEYEAQGVRLAGPEAKLFRDMLRDYRRMGFDLPEDRRTLLKDNLKRLAELTTRFGKNINDYKDRIFVSKEDLKGLPENYIASLKRNEQGEYQVTLEYPDSVPFMENAESAEKRKELAEKLARKGGEENMLVAEEILRLRDENARLLGYADHAAFRSEPRMAKNKETVLGFIRGLMDKLSASREKELAELAGLKQRLTGEAEARVEFYDTAYLSNQLKKEKFAVDDELVREYFPLETVREGMFRIYSVLFSVEFEPIRDVVLWHEDARLYAVKDLEGNILSYFVMDLHPREGKYGHAAAFNIISGRQASFSDETYVPPLACLVTNFPKPGAENPSLLSQSEVETFLHEFGHIMHKTLTEARYLSQAGSATAWDFVEAPSQMLEHWAWSKETLSLLSRHYRTGEPLPDTLLENMLLAKNHMIAFWTMRQLALAFYDMRIHTEPPRGREELNRLHREIFEKYLGVRPPETSLFLSGFGHFGGGYDAGYYSYMWAKVYAVDMFTRFEKAGLLDPETGRAYREEILSVGSSREEMDSVRAFLGREPSDEAFLKDIGIVPGA